MSTILPMTDEALELARQLLFKDEAIAFPTETVYGLGANALSAAAVERIYTLKGRPRHNPLIVHVQDAAAAGRLTAGWPAVASTLATHFWPGPLTLVLPRGEAVSPLVSAGRSTVAIRVPAHKAALKLLEVCGLPLAAPSANPSEGISPTTAEHVRRGLPAVKLILDGGPCRLGIESTVVDLTTEPPRLLRPGALPLRKLREVLPNLGLFTFTPDAPGGAALPAPGMLARHYAPRARLSFLPPGAELEAFLALEAPRGLLSHLDSRELLPYCSAFERLPADAQGYAADLYAALHRLDDREVKSIGVVPPQDPDDGDFYAILDRLHRAASEAPPALPCG